MEVIVAKNAGFCFGVVRAIETTESLVGKNTISTYGSLIHNTSVTNELEAKGVDIVEDIKDFKKEKLIIRSHGISKAEVDEMDNLGINFVDCTCPFVKKIHKLVSEKSKEGKQIVVIGDKNHPEVKGIIGWSISECIAINNLEDAQNTRFFDEKNYYVVAQTTFDVKMFEKIVDLLKSLVKNIEIKNTICNATSERQKSADEVSKIVTHMIVIGDKKSSNTNKLYEICRKNCKNTYLVERISDLQLNYLDSSDRIGITAGASTPLARIKEAFEYMSEIEREKTFEELLNESYVPPLHTGDVVTGKVITIAPNGEVHVSLQYKADGVIPRNEISNNPEIKAEDIFKKDDEIDVYVMKVNDGDGNVLLSKKRIENEKNLGEIEDAFNNGSIVTGKIVDIVKGGAIALILDARVFVPSSQISNKYINDLTPFKGQELNFKIIEFDKQKRRIVAGRKELAVAEEVGKREEVFKDLNVGDKVKGIVSRTSDFGAFVDIGGIDGLIHISELSWGRVKRVEDVVKVGEEVEVSILKLDKEKGKISLSLKEINQNPWVAAAEKYSVGSIVEGKVVRMVTFGAFVELEPGVDGLIHISQISDKHIAKPEEVLSTGDKVTVKVTDIDLGSNKISLSIKAALGLDEEATETAAE